MSIAGKAERDERNTLIADVLALVERIRQVMEEESALMQQHRVRELDFKVKEKNDLLAVYRAKLAQLRADAALLKGADPALLANLKAAARALAELAEREVKQIARLRTVNEGMIKAVGEHVARKSAPVQGYGKDAVLRPITPAQRPVARPASMILNQAV